MRNKNISGLLVVAFGIGLLIALICPTKITLIVTALLTVALGCTRLKA